MLWLIWLHVAAMTVAMTAFLGGGTMLRAIAARADRRTMAAAVPAASPVFAAGGIAIAIGVVAGLVLARLFGYGAPWLVGAYVLSALAALLGIVVDSPWSRRLAAAADDASFARVRAEAPAAIAGFAGPVLWLAILWLMIAKPG